MTDYRLELLLDLRDDRLHQRIERPVLLELHRRGHERKAAVKAAVGVPTSCGRLRRRVPQGWRLGVAPADVADRGHRAIRPHVQLDVRGRERRRPRACERINLVVVVTVEDPVGLGGERAIP